MKILMAEEQKSKLQLEIDQKFKETNELWKAWNDIQGNASLAVIKDFNRKLTAINREIAQLIKSLK